MEKAGLTGGNVQGRDTRLARRAPESDLKAPLSVRMLSVDTGRPMVEADPDLLLNTASPCSLGIMELAEPDGYANET